MAVYALYVPTARRPVSGIEMEKFPSREHTGRILKWRNNTKRSKTYYVVERERPADQEHGYFQDADRTGYMRVFLRYAADPVPGLLDTPDEEWILEKGGKEGIVVRLPWREGDERLSARSDRLRVEPAPQAGRPLSAADVITPEYEVRVPGLVKPVHPVCPGCDMVPSVTGRCNCS